MATATLSPPMTTKELLALPADGMDRWLIKGKLREKPRVLHNRHHSKLMASLGACLKNWRDSQPEPRGAILGGEAGIRLTRDPDTTVGVDVAYISPEVLAQQTDETTLIDGVPLLAVEILSPSDTVNEIHEKINSYLSAGVKLVWIIDPYARTATIYQPNARPSLVNEGQELHGDDVLPGFHVLLVELFR
jgi:Uma2 family endonuclease